MNEPYANDPSNRGVLYYSDAHQCGIAVIRMLWEAMG